LKLEKPDLYAVAKDGCSLNLIMGKCGACKRPHFPKTGYGCPRCGAPSEQVEEQLNSGRATLLNFITLHAKIVPGLDVPCMVGEAEIASGMIEEVMLLGTDTEYHDGMALQAVAHQVSRGDEVVLACRFAPVEE
jgi:uncharacterized OB-fold protein